MLNHALAPLFRIARVLPHTVKELAEVHVEVFKERLYAVDIGKRDAQVTAVFLCPHFKGIGLRISQTGPQRLTGLKVDFAQTLLERDGAGIVDTFRHFQAPDDFLIKPIETLVLLKQDTFQGSLTLTLRPHGTDILFRAEAFKGRDSVVQILGTIVIPTQSVGRLWGWTDGTIQSLTVQVQDVALLRRAAAYLHSVRQPLPEALTRALNTRTPLAFTIDLARPVPVLSLFQQGSAYVPTHNTETTF